MKRTNNHGLCGRADSYLRHNHANGYVFANTHLLLMLLPTADAQNLSHQRSRTPLPVHVGRVAFQNQVGRVEARCVVTQVADVLVSLWGNPKLSQIRQLVNQNPADCLVWPEAPSWSPTRAQPRLAELGLHLRVSAAANRACEGFPAARFCDPGLAGPKELNRFPRNTHRNLVNATNLSRAEHGEGRLWPRL